MISSLHGADIMDSVLKLLPEPNALGDQEFQVKITSKNFNSEHQSLYNMYNLALYIVLSIFKMSRHWQIESTQIPGFCIGKSITRLVSHSQRFRFAIICMFTQTRLALTCDVKLRKSRPSLQRKLFCEKTS